MSTGRATGSDVNLATTALRSHRGNSNAEFVNCCPLALDFIAATCNYYQIFQHKIYETQCRTPNAFTHCVFWL
jgi:hypothetical protein